MVDGEAGRRYNPPPACVIPPPPRADLHPQHRATPGSAAALGSGSGDANGELVPRFSPSLGAVWSISSPGTSQIGVGDPSTPHEPILSTDPLLTLAGLSDGHVASSVEAGAAREGLCPPQSQGWLLGLLWASWPSSRCQFGVLPGGKLFPLPWGAAVGPWGVWPWGLSPGRGGRVCGAGLLPFLFTKRGN